MIWAVVVFGDSSLRLLRWLKPGFRHCFVAVHTEVGWIGLDPLLHQAKLGWIPVHPDIEAHELADHYHVHGMNTAVCIVPEPKRRVRLPMPMTCTEAVKHVLGVRRPLILTPYQLWRFLIRSNLAVYSRTR